MQSQTYCLVGGGPATVLTIGAILEARENFAEKEERCKIIVLSPEEIQNFGEGSLHLLGSMPSNTTVSTFDESLRMFSTLPKVDPIPFPADEEYCTEDSFQWPKDKGDRFALIGDVGKRYKEVGARLIADGCIEYRRAWVTSVVSDKDNSLVVEYRVVKSNKRCFAPMAEDMGTVESISVDRVFLCTGLQSYSPEVPKNISTGGQSLIGVETDMALDVNKLRECVKGIGEDVSAVLAGLSHTGAMVAYNLWRLRREGVQIKCVDIFTRGVPVYAVNNGDGTYVNDNTGLKQIAAQFCRSFLDDRYKLADEPGFGLHISTGDMEVPQRSEKTIFINCCGYTKRPVPIVGEISHDGITGQIMKDGKLLHGVYGYGAAFPQKVDPSPVTIKKGGTFDWNIGLFKFALGLKSLAATSIWFA